MNTKLQERLNELPDILRTPAFLKGEGLGNDINYRIFNYSPEDELQVREYLAFLQTLFNDKIPDINLVQINLLEALKTYLQERNFLDKALQMQASRGDTALMKALKGPLHMSKFAPWMVRHYLSNQTDILFLTGMGSVWPLIRGHHLLNALHAEIDDKPVVLFYPGSYDGTTLTLFNQLPGKNYYRAFALLPTKD